VLPLSYYNLPVKSHTNTNTIKCRQVLKSFQRPVLFAEKEVISRTCLKITQKEKLMHPQTQGVVLLWTFSIRSGLRVLYRVVVSKLFRQVATN